MMTQSIETMRNIFDALMTISTRGNDTITMSNCLQALQNIIEMESAQLVASAPAEPQNAE